MKNLKFSQYFKSTKYCLTSKRFWQFSGIKSDDSFEVEYYWLIANISYILKLFETLTFNSIEPSLNNIFGDERHGFYPRHLPLLVI